MTINRQKMEAVLSLRDRLSGPLGRATRSVENHQETFRRVNIAMAGAATVLAVPFRVPSTGPASGTRALKIASTT